MQTDPAAGPVEARMATLAQDQHGVVARRQLSRIGVTKEQIDGRVRSGGLHLLHRGVYAVGHTAITRRGGWMAAVLASGDGAVLSHRSATALWGIWGSGTGEIHVTVPRKVRSQRSIRRHFSMLPDDEREVVDGIPVTSASRAVLDLAAEKGEAAAEGALREVEYLGIYGKVSLPVLLERYPKHRGTTACREALERVRDDPGGRLRSDLEERFITFLAANRIPRPRLNSWLSVGEDRFQVDCLWPEARLIAELDGWKSHGTKRAFRKDRKRDRRLGAAGFERVRITEDQVLDEPAALAADLMTLIYKRP
jgi:very-short-patch-repair endonuclease